MKQRRNRWNSAADTRTFAYDPAVESNRALQQQKWVRPIPIVTSCLIVEFELQRCLPDDATEDRIMVPLMVVVFSTVTSSHIRRGKLRARYSQQLGG